MRPEELGAGRVVAGRYEVISFLGQGGMGEVYAARRAALGDVVAIKRLLPDQDTPSNRARFATEAQAAAHIRHPNVVQVIDFGDDPDTGTYLVMELLEGPPLSNALADGPLPAERALWIFSQVCAAVEAGHRRGIVHRDLKPANVIIAASDDGTEIVKVLDFGLAIDQRIRDRQITMPGALVGTVAYMAPEQAEGRPATAASDIFALGVMLYEMVTGVLPFSGATPLSTLLAITAGHYRPADQLVPGLPRSLITAIDAALNRSPERRPASAELLARMASGSDAGALAPRGLRAVTADDTVEVDVRRPVTGRTTADTNETTPFFSRFVGRNPELGRLRDEYDATLAGRGRIALILGEAGVGKSRLAEHFSLWAREHGAMTLAGRFFDYAGSRPAPLDTFLSMLAAAGPRAAAAAAAAAETLAGEAASTGDRWRAFAAVADALVGQAAGRPLVLVLDDLQWASRLDLDLVDHLHRTLGPRGTQIVATARPGQSAELDPWRASRPSMLAELALTSLDDAEVRAWLDAVFRGLRIGSVDVRRLARTTGGNPYALAEIVRHLVSRGVFRKDEGGWRCAPLDSVELPDSVATVVRTRVAELAPVEQQILELAAVIGEEFRVDTLAAASGLGEDALDGILDGLFGRFITDRGVGIGADFRFTTPLVRQVLYDDMPARHRRRAHKAVVGALREVLGDRDDRWAHVFAYHCHAIGEWAEAVAFGVRGAGEALARHDFDAARASLARAEDAARRADAAGTAVAPTDRARLDLAAGVVDIAEGHYEDAEQRLAAGAELASVLGLVDVRLDALRNRARAALGRGDLRASSALARQAAAEATAAGERPRALEALAQAIHADIRAGVGDLAEVDALIAGTTTADPPALRARLVRERGLLQLKRGEWARGADDAAHAHALARAGGDLDVEQLAVALLGTARAESGDAAGAVEPERQALILAERLGDRRREAIARANMAETLLHLDQSADAVELLRGALGVFIDIGDVACEGDCRVNVGRALLAQGKSAEAIAMLERGIELCAATGRPEYEGIGYLWLGQARLDAGEVGPAGAAFARALERFTAIRFHLLWQAALGAAQAARAAGDRAATLRHARAALDEVAAQRGRLALGHDPASLDRARAEIEELITVSGI